MRFNTGASFDVGYFSIVNGAGALAFGDFLLTSVTVSGVAPAVPEPASPVLLLAGLLLVGIGVSRRNGG